MSKYTEAAEFLEHLEGKDLEFSWTDSGITELLKARDLAVDALEIADRLEQITKNGTNRITEVLCNDCKMTHCSRICFSKSDMINGYELALADIRGDTE